MNPEPQTASPEEPLNRVLVRMVETCHRSFSIIPKDKLVGVVAIEDILKGLYQDIEK